MPEPEQQKQADGDDDGRITAGQGEAGSETHTPPFAATDRTQATERAAKAPRLTPHRREATEKTRAEGNRASAAASEPGAQPTDTDADGETSAATAESAAREAGEG